MSGFSPGPSIGPPEVIPAEGQNLGRITTDIDKLHDHGLEQNKEELLKRRKTSQDSSDSWEQLGDDDAEVTEKERLHARVSKLEKEKQALEEYGREMAHRLEESECRLRERDRREKGEMEKQLEEYRRRAENAERDHHQAIEKLRERELERNAEERNRTTSLPDYHGATAEEDPRIYSRDRGEPTPSPAMPSPEAPTTVMTEPSAGNGRWKLATGQPLPPQLAVTEIPRWKCRGCSFGENDDRRTTCEECGNPRPDKPRSSTTISHHGQHHTCYRALLEHGGYLMCDHPTHGPRRSPPPVPAEPNHVYRVQLDGNGNLICPELAQTQSRLLADSPSPRAVDGGVQRQEKQILTGEVTGLGEE